MTLEMSPEQIQESKIYREWGLTDEEYLKIKDEILDGRLPNFTETEMYAVMWSEPVSYTHLRAHETDTYLVCRLLLEKKKKDNKQIKKKTSGMND